MFADMYLACDLLSDTMKSLLENLTAVHDGALPYLGNYKVARQMATLSKNEHHGHLPSRNGEEGFICEQRHTSPVKGLHPFESKALLNMLFSISTKLTA